MPDSALDHSRPVEPAGRRYRRQCPDHARSAQGAGKTDLVVFPELQLIGYPPEDLVQKPALIARAQAELDNVWPKPPADGGPAMLVGTVIAREGALFNGVALLDGGASPPSAFQARAAELRHVRRDAPVRARPAARAGRCSAA